MTNKELILTIENNILKKYDKKEKLTRDEVIDLLEHARSFLPYDKILMLEDGSVDTDDLENEIYDYERLENTKLIVYRQGSQKPEYLENNNEH